MVKQNVRIKNPMGLHLRPAGILCKEAQLFQCHVTFESKGGVSNAKSVLSILGACVKYNDEIVLICEGSDEEKALSHLVQLVEDGLGE